MIPEPNGCARCGIGDRYHATRIGRDGLHQWIEPSDAQRKWRMIARRAAREEVVRHPYFSQHAMNGSRKGPTLKRRFEDALSAVIEVEKLNAERENQTDHLYAYPCLYADDKAWGTSPVHWHMGRYRAPKSKEN